jgi:hypothetical protein
MTITARQREEWERKQSLALEKINDDIEALESRLDLLIKERDNVEAMTVEDSYFEFLAEQGSEK